MSTETERVDVWRKSGQLWRRHDYRDFAPLTSIGCELPVREVYRDLAGEA